MSTSALQPVSNKAGWTHTEEVIDDDTGQLVDLSQATIVFEVREPYDCTTVLSATTINGKIAVVDIGVFKASFTAEDMRKLEPVTHEVGCTIKNGTEESQQVLITTLPVLSGVVA